MYRNAYTKLPMLLALAGAMMGTVSAYGQTSYTSGSLKGNFAFSEQGTTGSAQPMTGIGVINFDGSGNVTGTESLQVPGQAPGTETISNFRGSYTVNSDGTGTLTVYHSIPAASEDADSTVLVMKYKLVLANGGKDIKAVRSDPGAYVVSNYEQQ